MGDVINEMDLNSMNGLKITPGGTEARGDGGSPITKDEENLLDLSGDRGVLKKILKEGTGTECPQNGCTVVLHYTGTLLNGTKFDSSLDRNEPFTFTLGGRSVIKGFDIGIGSMRKNEKSIITCLPNYAYGNSGSPPNIPPNATLNFELELLSWKYEDVSPQSDGSIERIPINKKDTKTNPSDFSLVKVHLTGSYEGRIFEEREAEFNVCEASDCNVIKGVELALLKFTKDETSKLIIKSKWAFGAKGHELFGIPPNATVEYIVHLKEFQIEPKSWTLTPEESVVQANEVKEKGNRYLKQEKYDIALKMYKLSDTYISNCQLEGEAKQTKIALFLNIALAHQKSENFFEAREACETVLEHDPKNIKALYRRGQCYMKCDEFDLALKDFQKVKELDPTNKAADNQIVLCNVNVKKYNEKEKKLYGNMFAKFADTDNKKEEKDRAVEEDVLTSCGEWNMEEEARREATRVFEEVDQNVVMI